MDVIVTDLEEVLNVPLYFTEGLAFVDPPSQVYEGASLVRAWCVCQYSLHDSGS